MAPNIEFYYLFFLLHTLCLTNTDSHKNLLEDSSFGLKSIIFSFWHLWGIKLYFYLFYWNSLKSKRTSARGYYFLFVLNATLDGKNIIMENYAISTKPRLSELIQYKNTHVKYMLSWNLNVININFFATRAEEFHVQLFDHHWSNAACACPLNKKVP